MKEVFCFCFCFFDDVSAGGGSGHWNGDGMGVSFLPLFAKGLWKLELCSREKINIHYFDPYFVAKYFPNGKCRLSP